MDVKEREKKAAALTSFKGLHQCMASHQRTDGCGKEDTLDLTQVCEREGESVDGWMDGWNAFMDGRLGVLLNGQLVLRAQRKRTSLKFSIKESKLSASSLPERQRKRGGGVGQREWQRENCVAASSIGPTVCISLCAMDCRLRAAHALCNLCVHLSFHLSVHLSLRALHSVICLSGGCATNPSVCVTDLDIDSSVCLSLSLHSLLCLSGCIGLQCLCASFCMPVSCLPVGPSVCLCLCGLSVHRQSNPHVGLSVRLSIQAGGQPGSVCSGLSSCRR